MGHEWIFFVAFALLIVAGIVVYNILERKRREALFELSVHLGLEFAPAKDYALPQQLQFLNKLDQGRNRYACNIFEGTYQGHRVRIFDYHFETHSRNSKGQRRTTHHHYSIYTVYLPQLYPELVIAPESFLSKVAQAFGYDDIDFESHEFSRKFCVRCRDKKFAYDICHARAMEFLLANTDMNIEIDNMILASIESGRLKPERVESRLNRLIEFRNLIPEYVFNRN